MNKKEKQALLEQDEVFRTIATSLRTTYKEIQRLAAKLTGKEDVAQYQTTILALLKHQVLHAEIMEELLSTHAAEIFRNHKQAHDGKH